MTLQLWHFTLTKTHLAFSVIAVILGCLAFCYYQKKKVHRFLGISYLSCAALSILLSFVLLALFLIEPSSADFNNNPSANFLRQFQSFEKVLFGYANAALRSYLFIFACLLGLKDRFSLPILVKKGLLTVLALLTIDVLIFIFHQPTGFLSFYYISIFFCFLQFVIGFALVRSPKFNLNQQHAFWTIVGLVIFLETGVLGGSRATVTILSNSSAPLFILERLIFFIIPWIYLLSYRKKSPSVV